MAIREGEVYGIAGESGCGKSTLLRVLMAAHKPPLTVVEGAIQYNFGDQTVDALHMTDEEVRDLRWKEISYVPQGSMHVLNPVRRIGDQFHDFISAHRQVNKRTATEMTSTYLTDLGLPA
jgi:peptide/nickel transport system ATP-binding protein